MSYQLRFYTLDGKLIRDDEAIEGRVEARYEQIDDGPIQIKRISIRSMEAEKLCDNLDAWLAKEFPQ